MFTFRSKGATSRKWEVPDPGVGILRICRREISQDRATVHAAENSRHGPSVLEPECQGLTQSD